MTPILSLALKSLWNRRATALLTVLAIGFSVALLLGVERVRTEARASFAATISGTDLVVGARSGALNLLLYSVFRIGNATANISWESVEDLRARKDVAWAVPISLGDSHRGYRVLGTSAAYFEHYMYSRGRTLDFSAGERFDDLFEAVVGSEVARKLSYKVGQEIVVAHGVGRTSFAMHDDLPFRVVGILAPTGTPVDRTVHVTLESLTAIHVDWQSGARRAGPSTPAEIIRSMDLTPNSVTAVLLGASSKLKIFPLQRAINTYPEEPLSAIIPGVALQELWDLLGVAERALLLVSGAVVLTGLVGLVAVLLAGLEERRREMAILRAVGARPRVVAGLLLAEAMWLTTAGLGLGVLLLYVLLVVLGPFARSTIGLDLGIAFISPRERGLIGIVFLAGLVAGSAPAFAACRRSLADGLTLRT